MRRLYIIIILCGLGVFTANAQQTPSEKVRKDFRKQAQKSRQSTVEKPVHQYICRRCGTENHLEWSFPSMNKHLELIPHCSYCGKKYWPKFKPSGLLERSYCQAIHPFHEPESMTIGSLRNSESTLD